MMTSGNGAGDTIIQTSVAVEGPKPVRPIHEIAREVRRDWKKVYFGAVPYLEAMFELRTMADEYGCDSAKDVVLHFLANANPWRGEIARKCKAELTAHCEGRATYTVKPVKGKKAK